MSKNSHLKYLLKDKETPVYITACAVVIDGKMLFVGNTHQECIDKATKNVRIQPQIKPDTFSIGYLGTDGQYYCPSKAGYIAYARRQTDRLRDPLQPEDILVTAQT